MTQSLEDYLEVIGNLEEELKRLNLMILKLERRYLIYIQKLIL